MKLFRLTKRSLTARMIKTDEEIQKLRENFAFSDLGHQIARREIAAGKTETEVWGQIHAGINKQAGQRVPLGNDLVVGYRNPNNIGGFPLDYEIRDGDSVIVDLGTGYKGYWSDSCATYFVGKRSENQQKIHKIITDALDYGISLVRPGIAANEVDAKLRKFIEDAGYSCLPSS